MSGSTTITDRGHSYTATVANEGDLSSPVTVTSGGYAITFDGNNFSTKHLRRIRRNSVSELNKGDVGAKIQQYVDESHKAALKRFMRSDDKDGSTNTLIFLDLGQYCQFGCQVIKFLASDRTAWTTYGQGQNQCLQKHAHIELSKCFASSNNGFGAVKDGNQDPEKLQHGIGINLNVTLKQPMGGNGRTVQVCHYAGGTVDREFSPTTQQKNIGGLRNIGKSIVT